MAKDAEGDPVCQKPGTEGDAAHAQGAHHERKGCCRTAKFFRTQLNHCDKNEEQSNSLTVSTISGKSCKVIHELLVTYMAEVQKLNIALKVNL